MKNILIGLTLMGILVGCQSAQETIKQETVVNKMAVEKAVSPEINPIQVLKLKGEDRNGFTGTLSTTDNWETAILVDNMNKTYGMERVISGSGIKLQDKFGNNVQFDSKEGIFETNGKEYFFTLDK
ncbi:MAG: hypothetical protein ACRC1R_07705 [Cetobacterium sp.]|uniref:hypothetical protein n=1 Tax=Cetobacterium sp. TaxID=2071632 RepID=UPI003F2EF199